MLEWSLWDIVGIILIVGGLFRLVAPEFVRKNKIRVLNYFIKLLKKISSAKIRVLGAVLILIGLVLIYYL